MFCVDTERSEEWERMLNCKQENRKDEMSDEEDTGTNIERSTDISKRKWKIYQGINISL